MRGHGRTWRGVALAGVLVAVAGMACAQTTTDTTTFPAAGTGSTNNRPGASQAPTGSRATTSLSASIRQTARLGVGAVSGGTGTGFVGNVSSSTASTAAANATATGSMAGANAAGRTNGGLDCPDLAGVASYAGCATGGGIEAMEDEAP